MASRQQPWKRLLSGRHNVSCQNHSCPVEATVRATSTTKPLRVAASHPTATTAIPSAAEPQPNYGTIRACPLIGPHFTLSRARPCSPWLLLAAQERTTGNTGGHGENQQGEFPRVEVSATYRQLKSTRYAKKQNVSSMEWSKAGNLRSSHESNGSAFHLLNLALSPCPPVLPVVHFHGPERNHGEHGRTRGKSGKDVQRTAATDGVIHLLARGMWWEKERE